jgi:hypothetical protein
MIWKNFLRQKSIWYNFLPPRFFDDKSFEMAWIKKKKLEVEYIK